MVGIFVVNMKHIPIANIVSMTFLRNTPMTSKETSAHGEFQWAREEQSKSEISLHLDAYIRETLDIYKAHMGTKILRPKSYNAAWLCTYI